MYIYIYIYIYKERERERERLIVIIIVIIRVIIIVIIRIAFDWPEREQWRHPALHKSRECLGHHRKGTPRIGNAYFV